MPLILLLLAACETGDRGQALYVQNCLSCHGVHGSGSAVAPRILGAPEGLIRAQMKGPNRVMPTFPMLQDEAGVIARYLGQ